jgi:hypothetical protein
VDPALLPDAMACQKGKTALMVSTAFRRMKDKRWRNLAIAWVVPELPAGQKAWIDGVHVSGMQEGPTEQVTCSFRLV